MRRCIFIVFAFCAFSMDLASSATIDAGSCGMPFPSFKFSYMDSLINDVKRPSDEDFIGSISNDVDDAKVQFYLWYVYRNPYIARKFFEKVDVAGLVDRKSDAINSIVWLMLREPEYFSSVEEGVMVKVTSILSEWKGGFRVGSEERSLILDLYSDNNYSLESFSKVRKEYRGDDVDLIVRMGVLSESAHRELEAIYYYTKASEYGYRGGSPEPQYCCRKPVGRAVLGGRLIM